MIAGKVLFTVSCVSSFSALHIYYNKKLSCRRETVPCFVSLNILLSHSRSLKLVPFESLGTVTYWPSKLALSCIISEIKRILVENREFLSASLYVSKRGA